MLALGSIDRVGPQQQASESATRHDGGGRGGRRPPPAVEGSTTSFLPFGASDDGGLGFLRAHGFWGSRQVPTVATDGRGFEAAAVVGLGFLEAVGGWPIGRDRSFKGGWLSKPVRLAAHTHTHFPRSTCRVLIASRGYS